MRELFVVVRCALCKANGIDMLKICRKKGKPFWGKSQRHRKLALSQRGPDSLPLPDPLSHITNVFSCGHSH